MSWELTGDVEAFASTSDDFLRSRPVEHTVFLTLVDTLRRKGPHAYGSGAPIFGQWRAGDGSVDGVLLQTPPHPMLFSRLPAGAVTEALDVLAGRPLPGVNMLADDAAAFVAGWPAAATERMRVRLYRLGELTPPPPPAGRARIADGGDRELLLGWFAAFHHEIDGVHEDDFGEVVDDRVGHGDITLWEVDGTPVSMAARSRPEAGMVRIQMVYTPAVHRGHGYGGAATSSVSRAALDAGASDVVLFTDLSNPTSNGLYQRLGYRPVLDRVVMEFAS
ncbi:GNAT family N-acetyltransferase [Paractinoplanes rhizophilus]|uniref:GNAT family N-acetyltransferase n=1 Tax=Paractinoplanes rhizophilus TaxID=1416877 RepID=A0ABW2HNF4_9ACTN|nr:GNAT family N-acetyltransferase [Actinoplanes sp.]